MDNTVGLDFLKNNVQSIIDNIENKRRLRGLRRRIRLA